MLPTRVVSLGAAAAIALCFVAMPEHPPVGDAAAQAAAIPAAVRIDNFNYSPPTLVVVPGTTVTWTNADDDVHTVVEKDRKFKSAALDTNDTFSQTFSETGEYEYFCSLHPRMTGKIVVKPAGSS
jgi:plastocyanin